MIEKFIDLDNDANYGIKVGNIIVFMTEQHSGEFALNFALESDIHGFEWMDRLTGFGAFKTMLQIKPAAQTLIEWVESQGRKWHVCCDSRRAKLYSRYIPTEKIYITE